MAASSLTGPSTCIQPSQAEIARARIDNKFDWLAFNQNADIVPHSTSPTSRTLALPSLTFQRQVTTDIIPVLSVACSLTRLSQHMTYTAKAARLNCPRCRHERHWPTPTCCAYLSTSPPEAIGESYRARQAPQANAEAYPSCTQNSVAAYSSPRLSLRRHVSPLLADLFPSHVTSPVRAAKSRLAGRLCARAREFIANISFVRSGFHACNGMSGSERQ